MLLPHEACTLRPVTFCVMSVFHVPSTHRVTAGAATDCLMRELYSMDCVTTAWLMVLSHKGSLILHCVTVAAATPSLHTQSWKRFLPGVGVWTAWRLRDWCCCAYCLYCIATAWLMQLSHVQRPMSGGSLQAAWWESCTVWTAWRLRDWWCCLTRAAWFYTAWLLLLPHQACTLSPENGFCLVLVYELRDWCCVTDMTDVTCTEAHEWGEWTRKCGYRTAWQLYCLDCVTGGAVAELGLSDQSAWQLRGWCCGHARPAHPVLHTIGLYIKCQAFVANALRLR